jgi:putative ABC transport system ATP-binding protein
MSTLAPVALTDPVVETERSPIPLVAMIDVTKTYGHGTTAFQALRGVNFAIRPGEFVAIMGPSGSGKSTVMNILGCLDVPTTGSYRFNGIAVEELSRNQRALLRRYFIGFVFQGFNLLPRTTGIENVELPLLYRGVGATERRLAAMEALDLVGLRDWADHAPSELSGGQQQRVAIARALVTNPEVLLADEPTGNLDTQRSREVMELIASLNRDRGITVVMVTHEPDIAAHADRIIHFVDGQVESDRTKTKVLS